MPIHIGIVFDKDPSVYFSGQSVSGTVVVTSNKNISSNGLYLSCKCIVKTAFKYGTKLRQSKDTLYSLNCKLLGDDSNTQQTIPAGINKYPFAFTLPESLLPSFQGPHGEVTHFCEATLSLLKRLDKKFRKHFSATPLVDLNANDWAKGSLLMKKNSPSRFKSGPIAFEVDASHRGFVPGEKVLLNAKCLNESSTTISYTSVKIYQKVIHETFASEKLNTNREVCNIKLSSIPLESVNFNWSHIVLEIPPLPPSFENRLLKVSYFIKFTLKPSGLSMKLSETAPIIIGNVPLREQFNSLVSSLINASHEERLPSHELQDSSTNQERRAPTAEEDRPPPYFPAVDNYPELPPPTYNECVFGRMRSYESDCSDDSRDSTEDFSIQYVIYSSKNICKERSDVASGS